jgi:putative hydrolase of the HAD superfamily
VVFLDLGDTLIRAHPSWSAVYRRVLAEHGVDVEPDALRAALDRTFGHNGSHIEGPFEASESASYQRLKEFDTRVLEALGAPVPDDGFFRSLEAAFSERAAWWIFEDVPGALDVMQAAGIRLALISNWGWAAPELMHTLALARHFEALIISDRVGYLKPSAGIFQHALEVMRVTAADAIHVGDSVPADVIGAHGVGIRPVLIDRATHVHGGLGDPPDASPPHVPRISDLWDLVELLGLDRPVAAVTP